VGRFNLQVLNDVEVKKQFQVKIPNGFMVLENLNQNLDISRALKSIRKNIKTSAKSYLNHYE
jgi:hypothetical protein